MEYFENRTKRILALLSCLSLFSSTLTAATYTVATTGNDLNDGSFAQPFRTLQHAITTASAGDRIEVLPGVYQEATVVTKSGTASDPIVIAGLERIGDRPAAIFSAFKTITPGTDGFGTWQLHAGNIWKIQLPATGWSLPIGQNMLLEEGEPRLPARWPTASAPVDFDRRGMATATDGNVDLASAGPQSPYTATDFYTGTYIDPELANFDPAAWVGAHIDVCAGLNWWSTTGYVIGNNGNTLNFRYRYAHSWPSHYDEPAEGDRYALWGHLSALTDPGEFFLDVNGVSGAANMLYLWLPDGSSPAGKDIALRVLTNSLTINGSSHLQFENLSFEGGSIQLDASTDSITLDRLDLRMAAINRNKLIFSGNRSINLRGNNLRVANSYIRFMDGFGIWSDGTGVEIVNNVIGTSTQQSIDVDRVSDSLIEGNTLFEGGQVVLAIGAKNSLITRNHAYFAGMRSVDLAIFNTWNAGDMLGTVISYNWAHGNLAPRDSSRSWFGGQGIRFDAGDAPLGVSNGIIHHNVVWDTTSDSDVTAWGLTSGQLNYADSKIGIYHNTMEKDLVIGGIAAGASTLGHTLKRNISRSFNGNSTEAVVADNVFEKIEIAGNITANPRYVSAINRNYSLRDDSPARNVGTAIPGITEVGGGNYVGAYNPNAPAWRPGAIIRAEDLELLQASVVESPLGFQSVEVSGLPVGRTVPDSFNIRVAGRLPDQSDIRYYFEEHNTVASYDVDLSGLSGSVSFEVSLNGVDYITPDAATVEIPPITLQNDLSLSGIAAGGGSFSIATDGLFGEMFTKHAIELSGLVNFDFSDYPVPFVFDTSAWIAEGMAADASDLRFYAGDGERLLNHYIESGLGTPYTLIWLQDAPEHGIAGAYASDTNESFVYVAYGDGINYATAKSDLLLGAYPFLEDANLLLHLKGNTLANSFTDGSAVQIWPDASASGNDAVQNTEIRQPTYAENRINGLGVMDFDGSYDFMDVNGAAGLGVGVTHVFAMFRNPDPGSTTWQKVYSARNNIGDTDWQDGIALIPQNVSGVMTPQVEPWRSEFKSGVDTRSRENLRLGATSLVETSLYRGELAEIMIFDESIDWGDKLLSIRHYLDRKWGRVDSPVASMDSANDVLPIQVFVDGVLAPVASMDVNGNLSFQAPAYSGSSSLPFSADVELVLPDGTSYLFAEAFEYVENLALVDDSFTDGDYIDGSDPLDLRWYPSGGTTAVVSDAILDAAAPNNVLELTIDSADVSFKDEYLSFKIPELVELQVGEALRLSYRIRFTGTPGDSASRTGVSLAYRNDTSTAPWGATGNREYFATFSYGNDSDIGSIRKSQDEQFLNTGEVLEANTDSVNLGTQVGTVAFQVSRISQNRMRIEYQLNGGPVQSYIDNTGLIFDFNRAYLRYRRATTAALEAMRVDEVVIERLLVPTELEIPLAPSTVSVQAVTSGSTSVSWVDEDPYTTGFELQRSLYPGGGFATIATLPSALTNFVDTGLVPATEYYYRVRAIGDFESSPYSVVASVTTDDFTVLVSDRFEDGGTTNGIDPLDVNWYKLSPFTLLTDSGMNPDAPNQVAELAISANDPVLDSYIGFAIPGEVTLAEGEGLRLSFQLSFPDGARTDASRTGVSFGYRADSLSPWENSTNREYYFFTSYGDGVDGALGTIRKSSALQILNDSNAATALATGTASADFGTTPGAVMFEIKRISAGEMRIRYQLDGGVVQEVVDSSNLQTLFNQIFLRFRSDSTTQAYRVRVSDMELIKLEALPVSITPHETWRLDHFGQAEPSGNAAPDADPDGDGVINFLEYAFGSDPQVHGNVTMPVLSSMIVSGREYPMLVIERNPAALDLSYQVELSFDLFTWHTSGQHLINVTDTDSALDVRSLMLIDEAPKQFMRLSISE